MDIQVASNFERLLFLQLGRDGAQTAALMERFRAGRRLELPGFDSGAFGATRTDDDEIVANIRQVHGRYGYTIDPHTACGFTGVDRDRPTVVLATAHPAKFPEVIRQATGTTPVHPALEALKERTPVVYRPGSTPDAVRAFIRAHAAP
jgi:threonine synthase